MKPPRFRQSMAKTLLAECPAVLRHEMVHGKHTTKAMDQGSLLDYLVFGQDDRYEIVDAVYRSGPREGEQCEDWTGKEARQSRDEIRSRGLLPVLSAEIDALEPAAEAIRGRLTALSLMLSAGQLRELRYQPHIEWTSALGIECEGTPDAILIVPLSAMTQVWTIDVKHTAFMQQAKFERQIHQQGWDLQGAAYAEAAVSYAHQEGFANASHVEHIIVASSAVNLGIPPPARPLEPSYLAVGARQWMKAQLLWQECLDSGQWPSYPEKPAAPPMYVVRTLEEYDATDYDEPEEP
jgi:hypothetical protein